MTAWLAEQKRIYFGNANSVKEYRIQLRSTKTVWYWGIYLGILVLVALANYGSIGATTGDMSPTSVQMALTTYYQLVTGFIHAALLLIAPMMAASAIMTEYELRSIELVQCAPVSTKYFFVGKFISCLRQILLLLFLALPIAAVGVTLGGASWPQILEQFAYIGMQAAIFAAIAMPLAIVTQSIVRAVAGVIGIGLMFMLFSSILVGVMFASGGGAGFPALTGLIPFLSAISIGQSTPIGPMLVPNWLVSLIICVLLVKVILLGAGSAMTRVGSKETLSLRIHGLVLTALFATLIGIGFSFFPIVGLSGVARARTINMILGMPMLLGFFQILVVTGHGRLEERKFFADRLFDLQDTFRGRPSGAIGYSLLVTLAIVGGVALPMLLQGVVKIDEVLAGLIWSIGFTTFLLGLCWHVSTFFDLVTPARRATFGLLIAMSAVCYFVGLTLDGVSQGFDTLYMLVLNPFLPFSNSMGDIFVKSVVLIGGGVLFLIMGEARRRNNLQILRKNGYLVDRDEITSATA